MNDADDGNPPLPVRSRKTRDAVLLGLCALVMVVAAGASLSPQRAPRAAPGPPEAGAQLPSPLPSGAAAGLPLWSIDDDAGCHVADRGFGDYERWRPLPLGRVLIPRGHGVDSDGTFDLLVHFHGADAVRKLIAPERLDLVIAGVDAGTMSGSYTKALTERDAWQALIASVEAEVARTFGVPSARARNLAVSSWSAGYGAIATILERREPSVDAIILLDSLHTGYAAGKDRPESGQLSVFVKAARDATRGGPLFYLTHTEVPTDGYASTSRTASFLLEELGTKAIAVTPDPELRGPLRLTRMVDEGRLFLRGYAGGGKDDHCAQLRLLPGILFEHVIPAFQADVRP